MIKKSKSKTKSKIKSELKSAKKDYSALLLFIATVLLIVDISGLIFLIQNK